MEQPDVKRQVDNRMVHSSARKRLTDVQNAVQSDAQQVQKSDNEERSRHRVWIQIDHRILALRLSLKL